MNTNEFLAAVNHGTLAVMLRKENAVNAMADVITEHNFTDQVVYMDVRHQGLLVSSGNQTVVESLVNAAKNIKGAEVIRRLTLEDIAKKIREFYDETKLITVPGRGDRQYQALLSKSSNRVTVHTILDPGMRKEARVLAITLMLDYGRWMVANYTVQQYRTSLEGVQEEGEPANFLVSDFEEQEYEADNRTALERCRDAVVEYKITGGKGEEVWVNNLIDALIAQGKYEDKASANDEVQQMLVESSSSTGKMIFGITGMAISVVNANYPLNSGSGRGIPRRSRRDDRSFGHVFADKLSQVKAAMAERK